MTVNLNEGRCWRRMAASLLFAAMSATFPASATRSAEPITWERLSQMGGGIDFPHIMGSLEIRATLERMRGYAISDGTPQTLFYFVSTNCRRGAERPATINCGGTDGPKVYIPVLFVTPSAPRRRGNSPPQSLVLTFRGTNSLEHSVAEDPAHPRSSRPKSVWIKLDTPLDGMKTLDAPAVQAALVLCVPVSSSECQNGNVQLANLADESEQAVTLPPRPANPPPGSDDRSHPPAGPEGQSAHENPQPSNPPPGPANPPHPANPPGPRPPDPSQQNPNPPGPASVEVAQPSALGGPPGPWLLGLYGPQNIGIGVDASAGAIADAQEQILASMTRFLDDFHAQSFRSPVVDLVLMTTPDAAAAAFPLKNVLNGTSRQPPADRPGKLQLDHEGDRRLAAFLSGPTSSGAEASLKSIGDMIRTYAQHAERFRAAPGQRPPVAIYVGAVRPLPDTCAEWKKMTGGLALLPGRPRVLGVVFANVSAGQIDQQLGHNERGESETIAARTRAPTCSGDGGSALLFVPFPDLISHTPESVLTQVFGAVRRRAGQLQN
jgi:hypothetical protein